MARPRLYDDHDRDRLLDEAGRLLTEHGPGGVTVRAVADAAGVTTRAIYALFGSMPQLLRAVRAAGFEGLAATLATAPRSDDPLRDLRALGVAYRQSARQRPHLYEAMFGTTTILPTAEEDAPARATLGVLTEAVARCQDAGQLPGDDPWPATHALWALVHGLTSLELRGAFGDDAAADAAWLAAFAMISEP